MAREGFAQRTAHTHTLLKHIHRRRKRGLAAPLGPGVHKLAEDAEFCDSAAKTFVRTDAEVSDSDYCSLKRQAGRRDEFVFVCVRKN